MGVFRKKKNGKEVGPFYIDYRVNGRRKRERIGSEKKLAQITLKKRYIEIAEGKFLDKKTDVKERFSEFSHTYIEMYAKPNKRSWKKSDATHIKRFLSEFGHLNLQEITTFKIEQYKQQRIKQVSPATVNRELACLKVMFKKAVEWGKMATNPARSIKLLRENNRRLRYLSQGEINTLLKHCPERLRPIVVLALNTGMRKGELQGLRWSDIDINSGTITLLATKNGRKRHLYINEPVKRALFAIRKHPDSDYIFHKGDGSPYNFRKAFETALSHAGITNFRFHDLRHTFASHMVMSGVDIYTLKEVLGHKSIEMTMRYSHLSNDHERQAMSALGQKMDTIWTPVVQFAFRPDVEHSTSTALIAS